MKQREAKAFMNAIQEAMEAEYKRQVSISIKEGLARKKQREKVEQS